MVKLLLAIKHRFPFVWFFIEWVNSVVFSFLYGRKLKKIVPDILKDISVKFNYRVLLEEDMPLLCDFFSNQHADSFRFFKPHNFDLESLYRKNEDKSFLMIGAFSEGELVGYCFLRCFFNKQAFRGKIVASEFQGLGIAKQMGILTTDICRSLNFRLFATISKENVKSIASSKAVNTLHIVKELPDNYLYVEYLLKE